MPSQETRNKLLHAWMIIMVFLSLFGTIHRQGWKLFAFYTQLSSLMELAASTLYLRENGNLTEKEMMLMHLSAGMLMMTFIVVVCVLIPMGAGVKAMLWEKGRIFTHVLVPITGVCCFLKDDKGKLCEYSWVVMPVVTIIYGIVMMTLNGLNLYQGPYPFFEVNHQSTFLTVFWIILLGSVSALISLFLQKMHNHLSR